MGQHGSARLSVHSRLTIALRVYSTSEHLRAIDDPARSRGRDRSHPRSRPPACRPGIMTDADRCSSPPGQSEGVLRSEKR